MEIVAIIEHDGVGGYRARCRHPVEAEATGYSSYDARLALESVLNGRISTPFSLLPVEVPPDKPWIATAGSIPNDAVLHEWLDAIAEYRRECEVTDQQSLSQTPTTQTIP